MSAARARKTVDGRSDPKPRHLDNNLPGQRLRGADLDRHYIWANKHNGGEFDVSYYLAIAEGLEEADGYRVEICEESGVRVGVGSIAKLGDPIEFRGMVLMSCPLAFKRLIEEVGEMGQTGQRGANRIAALVKKRKGSYEDLSDVKVDGISVQTKKALDGLPEEE